MSNPLSAAVGRITAAVATVHNEKSLSLANINFDFTLVKLAPPKEYDGLGASISGKRKLDAEDGELHRTARKLGALFEMILPPTPALFRAYGQRVSEISQSELVSPQASSRHGIFTKELGADSKSIGQLIFTIAQATAIWDELVQSQKQWIRQESAKTTYSNKYDAALVAAQQELSRGELGKWDASARSWLESADLVKAREHKQLMLILDNASVPINSEGIPQQVQDGAVLLGISAWHLYPNLTVLGCGFGTTDVEQRDKMFSDTAVITLGIRVVNESQKSVSWSLPLAYLSFYGKPVKTLRSVGQENSRVSMEEFAYIVVGCVFGGWGAFATSFEEGAQWLDRIMELITKEDSNGLVLAKEVQSASFWLSHLWGAVKRLRGCNEIDRKYALQLYALGQRRPKFLSGKLEHPPPLFGLSNMSVLLPMMQTCELRVAFLRRLAKDYDLPSDKFIIRYHTDGEGGDYPYEYATLGKVEATRPKRFRSGLPKHLVSSSAPPIRWVAVPVENMARIYHCRRAARESAQDHSQEACGTSQICVPNSETLCPLCCHSLHAGCCETCAAPLMPLLWARSRDVNRLGEDCRLAVETTLHDQSMSHSNKSRYLKFGEGTDFETDLKLFRPDIYNDMSGSPTQKYAGFSFVMGDPKSAAILEIKLAPTLLQSDQHKPQPLLRAQFLPSQVETLLRAEIINTSPFKDYFLHLGNYWEVYCGSLKAFAAALDLFKHLTNATVSASVSSKLLLRSRWVPRDQSSLSYFSLSRSQPFSCISMFDSGVCDLEPEALEEVFALSVGSSIYVTEATLCDPYQLTKDTNIRRVIGNLGRAGISLLIPPADPAVREPDDDSWTQINHAKFDGQVEDSFQHTSIHLSFNGYEMPLSIDSGSGHTIDRPACLLETLVSVYDRGTWVADFDMSTLLSRDIERLVCSCNGVDNTSKLAFQELSHADGNLQSLQSWTCIDNWDEFIDPPRSRILVIRAHRNWLARLAFASISVTQGYRTVVLPDSICWRCCKLAVYGNLPRSELVVEGSAVESERRIVLIS